MAHLNFASKPVPHANLTTCPSGTYKAVTTSWRHHDMGVVGGVGLKVHRAHVSDRKHQWGTLHRQGPSQVRGP